MFVRTVSEAAAAVEHKPTVGKAACAEGDGYIASRAEAPPALRAIRRSLAEQVAALEALVGCPPPVAAEEATARLEGPGPIPEGRCPEQCCKLASDECGECCLDAPVQHSGATPSEIVALIQEAEATSSVAAAPAVYRPAVGLQHQDMSQTQAPPELRAIRRHLAEQVAALEALVGGPSSASTADATARPEGPIPEERGQCCAGLTNRVSKCATRQTHCSECARPIRRGHRLWECRVCRSCLCPACRVELVDNCMPAVVGGGRRARQARGKRGARAEPEMAAPLRDETPISATAMQEVLAALRSIPEVAAKAPPLWVPRSCAHRAGCVLRELLDDAVRHAEAPTGHERAELAHLLLRAAGTILFRAPPGLADKEHEGGLNGEGSSFSASYAAAVQRRLQLAQHHEWLVLLRELQGEPHPSAPARHEGRVAEPTVEWDTRTLTRAAVLSRAGSTRAAAATLVDQPPVPPTPRVVEQLRGQFRTQELSDDELRRRHGILRRIGVASLRSVQPVTPKKAAAKADQLKAAAGPGPSGFRNGYIQLVRRVQGGPESLARWCNMWSCGRIVPDLADYWTPAVLRPFWKPAPAKEEARPVACAEALLKYAVGAQVELQGRRLKEALGPRQFGAGNAAGASAQIAQVRAHAKAQPGRALLQLDLRNAFGSVDRTDALEITLAKVPGLAPLLAAQWGDRPQRLWAEAEPGNWVVILVYGGLLQGGQDGQPIFCLVLSAAVDAFLQALPDHVREQTTMFLFVDDVTCQTLVPYVRQVVSGFASACHPHNLALAAEKSTGHVPAWVVEPPTAAARKEVEDVVPITDAGLVLLGGLCNGMFAAPLEPDRPLDVGPAELRTRRAERLGAAVAAMAEASLPCGGKQPAWLLTQRAVSHALDYDARICPVADLLPLAQRVDQAVERAVEACVGVPSGNWPDGFREQLALPTDLGGYQIQKTSDMLPAARVAEFIEGGPQLRAALAGVLPAGVAQADVDETPTALAAQALLKEHGVCIGRCGQPGTTECRDALTPESPAKHLLSAYLRAMARERHAALLERLLPEGRARIRSAGGPNAGKCMLAAPTTATLAFNDIEWAEGLRWRGGFPQNTPGQRCANVSSSEEPCGEVLDSGGIHAATCPRGPCVNARHRGVVAEVGALARATGATTRCEVPIAELEDEAGEQAILDLVVWGGGELQNSVLDITVRHPVASRYMEAGAAKLDGACAAKAEEEKAEAYPPRGGVAVTAFAAETYGRLGLQAEQFIRMASAAAARCAHERGHPAARLSRWRAAIDAAIMRGVVRGLRAAREGLGGTALRRLPACSNAPAPRAAQLQAPMSRASAR